MPDSEASDVEEELLSRDLHRGARFEEVDSPKQELEKSRSSLAKAVGLLLNSRALIKSTAVSIYGAQAGSFIDREAKKDKKELSFILTVASDGWSSEQRHRLLEFLLSVPDLMDLGTGSASIMSRHLTGVLVNRGMDLYDANIAADAAYIIVSGEVTLYEEGWATSDGARCARIVEVLQPSMVFGGDELLASCRRVHRAEATQEGTLLLRVPAETYMRFFTSHADEFNTKVDFLSNPRLLGCMGRDVIMRLAPCFTRRDYQPGECLVVQGQPADTVILILAGHAAVLVDARWDAGSGLLPETDPKRCKKICVLGSGSMVGDMAALSADTNKTRTASVRAECEVQAYEIVASAILRRLPADKLEELRAVAGAKKALMAEHAPAVGHAARLSPANAALRARIMHGRDLRGLDSLNAQQAGRKSRTVSARAAAESKRASMQEYVRASQCSVLLDTVLVCETARLTAVCVDAGEVRAARDMTHGRCMSASMQCPAQLRMSTGQLDERMLQLGGAENSDYALSLSGQSCGSFTSSPSSRASTPSQRMLSPRMVSPHMQSPHAGVTPRPSANGALPASAAGYPAAHDAAGQYKPSVYNGGLRLSCGALPDVALQQQWRSSCQSRVPLVQSRSAGGAHSTPRQAVAMRSTASIHPGAHEASAPPASPTTGILAGTVPPPWKSFTAGECVGVGAGAGGQCGHTGLKPWENALVNSSSSSFVQSSGRSSGGSYGASHRPCMRSAQSSPGLTGQCIMHNTHAAGREGLWPTESQATFSHLLGAGTNTNGGLRGGSTAAEEDPDQAGGNTVVPYHPDGTAPWGAARRPVPQLAVSLSEEDVYRTVQGSTAMTVCPSSHVSFSACSSSNGSTKHDKCMLVCIGGTLPATAAPSSPAAAAAPPPPPQSPALPGAAPAVAYSVGQQARPFSALLPRRHIVESLESASPSPPTSSLSPTGASPCTMYRRPRTRPCSASPWGVVQLAPSPGQSAAADAARHQHGAALHAHVHARSAGMHMHAPMRSSMSALDVMGAVPMDMQYEASTRPMSSSGTAESAPSHAVRMYGVHGVPDTTMVVPHGAEGMSGAALACRHVRISPQGAHVARRIGHLRALADAAASKGASSKSRHSSSGVGCGLEKQHVAMPARPAALSAAGRGPGR